MVEVLTRKMARLIDRLSHDYPQEWAEFMTTFNRVDGYTFPDGTRIEQVRVKP